MNQPSFNNTASTNEHGLSQFYARIYGYLGIGIALSALSSFLMMNVFYEQFIGMLTQSLESLSLNDLSLKTLANLSSMAICCSCGILYDIYHKNRTF